jgi:hypothetical protein
MPTPDVHATPLSVARLAAPPRPARIAAAPRPARIAAARRPARALWAGPGAARVLTGPPAVGVVEFALRPGGYVRFGDDAWLLVAVPSAPRGPLSLLVAGLEAAPLRPGDAAVLDAAALHVGAHHIARVSSYSCIAPVTARSRGWRPALAAALAEIPPAPPALEPGLRALRRDDLAGAVLALAGRGEGLTPAGDDVLAGFAAWRAANGRPVALTDGGAAAPPREAAPRREDAPLDRDAAAPPRDAAPHRDPAAPPRDAAPHRDPAAPPRDAPHRDAAAPPRDAAPHRDAVAPHRDVAALTRARCAPLGLAYLRCAQRGELAEPVEAVLRAVRSGDASAARWHARRVSTWGASSGAAMLWGMAAAA